MGCSRFCASFSDIDFDPVHLTAELVRLVNPWVAALFDGRSMDRQVMRALVRRAGAFVPLRAFLRELP
jgi:hypothetical protein